MQQFFLVLWLSSIVSAQATQRVVTITEFKCSTLATLPVPTYNSTQTSSSPTYPSSSSTAWIGYSPLPSIGTGGIVGSTGPGSTGPPPGGLGASGPGALSPSAQDTVDYLFWLNYAQAIMNAAKVQSGDNTAFFIGSDVQKGPVAGDYVPDEYTNQGLYDIGNNLLNDSSLFYSPSSSHGYIQALRNYLDWVDLEAKPTAAQDAALLNAMKDQAAAQVKLDTETDLASTRFGKEETMGLTNGQTFYQWIANGNAPAYNAAKLLVQQIAARIESIQSQIYGAKAAPVMADRSTINKGFEENLDNAGYNMRAAIGNVLSPRELINLNNLGKEADTPSFHRVPSYNAPRYKAFVQEAQVKAGGDYDPADSATFSVDTGKSTSDYHFGQTTVSARYGGGWFSFWGASGSHSTESTTLRTGSSASSVSIKMTFDAIEAIPITPGQWNIDISQYKLRKDAPASLKELVRPTQLVVANRLGYEITVNDALADSLDTHFKETTTVKGGFSIFGISIWGGTASRTDERNTHEASFDRASRTVKVVPKDDTGVATLIGVVGEKFKILSG